LLIKITNTTNEKESNDIREFMRTVMKLVKNNNSSFHNLIYKKFQGYKDFKNRSLKQAIIENQNIFFKIFEDLKKQGITNISLITLERFNEESIKNRVRMSEEEIKQYYNLLSSAVKKKL